MTEEGRRKRKKGKKIKEANTRPRRSDFYRLEFFRPDLRASPTVHCLVLDFRGGTRWERNLLLLMAQPL